jgi:hypothetical protein
MAKTVFDTDYADRNFNNSRMPDFVFDAAAATHVWFVADGTSPCTGSTAWLMCADADWNNDGIRSDWRIYVRDVEGAPVWYSGVRAAWLQRTGACPVNRLCFDARRAFIHEILHVTLGAPHNEQGEAFTVMSKTTPNSPHAGWNTHHIQPCDEAAAQLLYDVANSAGQYSNCFDHLPNAVPAGLDSNLTRQFASYGNCTGYAVSVAGRLEITDYAAYGRLGGNPLTSRTIAFDRRLRGTTTWTQVGTAVPTNAAGNNWTKSFSAPTAQDATYEFRARYAGESGVGSATSAIFTITWSRAC